MGKIVHFLITIICLVIIVIVAYMFWINSDIQYTIIDSGDLTNFDNMIISSIDEYNEFISNSDEEGNEYKNEIISSNKYDENYFQKKSLALAYVSGEGGNELTGVQITVIFNKLNIKTNLSYVGDSAVTAGKVVLVEVNKLVKSVDVK